MHKFLSHGARRGRIERHHVLNMLDIGLRTVFLKNNQFVILRHEFILFERQNIVGLCSELFKL